MKNMILLVLLVFSLVMSGCDTRTQYGECIGVLEDPDPSLVYSYDYGNILIGAIFSETLVVPAIVIADCYKCPTSKK